MPVSKRRRLVVIFLGLILTVGYYCWLLRPSSSAYTITDLGTLPGATVSSASGINNRGEIVGLTGPTRLDLRHTFLYRKGVMQDLGVFGLIGSHDGPMINGQGQITGVMQVNPLRRYFHGFLYNAGKMHDLGTLPGESVSLGNGINNQSQIVGYGWEIQHKTGLYVDHAFLYSGGKMARIGTLPGYPGTIPASINSSGQIAGYCERQLGTGLQAIVYDSRTKKMTALATPPGFTDSFALAMNDRAQIIGSAALSNQKEQAVLWNAGRATFLGTLPGLDNSNCTAINNRGEIVGAAWSGTGALSQFVNDHPIRLKPLLPLFPQSWTKRAFVYRSGKMQDLNALIPAHSGWVLEAAAGINDRGQIIGRGLHHGQERAFLLTPLH